MTAFRLALSRLVLLALLLGALVPAGFMPAFKAGGGMMRVEICTASGFSTVLMPAGEEHRDNHQKHEPSCPYAPVLAHALAAPAMVAVPPVLAAGPLHVVIAAAVPAPAKPWFSQGPPLS